MLADSLDQELDLLEIKELHYFLLCFNCSRSRSLLVDSGLAYDISTKDPPK